MTLRVWHTKTADAASYFTISRLNGPEGDSEYMRFSDVRFRWNVLIQLLILALKLYIFIL